MTESETTPRQVLAERADALVRGRNWIDALTVLDQVLARWPGEAHQHQELQRARVLRELGRVAESEAALRRLLDRRPKSKAALKGLVRSLVKSGRPQEALRALDNSPLSGARHADLLAARLVCLIAARRLDEARVEFRDGMSWASDVESLTCLLEVAPRLFSGRDRTETWLGLLERVARLASDVGTSGPVSCLAARLRLALRDYDGYLRVLDGIGDDRLPDEYAPTLAAVADALRRPSFPDYSRVKIFGIGLSKTGTTSLAKALTILGYPTADWVNPLTQELTCDDLALFEPFTDTPSCLTFERNFYMYRQSKFILTTRPLRQWAKSWAAHIERLWGISDFSMLRSLLSHPDNFNYGKPFSDIQMTLYGNFESLETAYESYHRRVRLFFSDKPKDRLLEFDILSGAGWPELCRFLGVPIPDEPFPWEKRAPVQTA